MADEEAGDDSGATDREEWAASPAAFQVLRRDLAEEGRAAYADATAKLDRAYEAIYYGTGTNDDKRAVEIERDNVARLYVALALAEQSHADPDDEALAAVRAAEQFGVGYPRRLPPFR